MNSQNSKANKKRIRYRFSGIVQGVGFRPFIYRIAVKNHLSGFVQNTPAGVIAETEGASDALKSFLADVQNELPPLAHVTQIETSEIAVRHDNTFAIIPSSEQGQADVHITPDAATCPDCLKELFDSTNRRFRYPFANCTNCGPRLTIINAIPYDRANTSMSCFSLCEKCRAEYENPADRRFHAEPNACPVCGPQLKLYNAEGNAVMTDDPIQTVIDLLLSGHVLAIKGLGGFHLSVDAGNDEAVKKLRSRKYREEKPLAIMTRDINVAKQIAEIGPEEEKLLLSPQRPIVLLKKIKNNLISGWVAPDVPYLGIMLPYTPLHHLLLENHGDELLHSKLRDCSTSKFQCTSFLKFESHNHFTALVMTSANQVDEPICIGNREAFERLQGIADYYLMHNRDILVRCDDSIAFVADKKPRLLRRARGYVPQPLQLKDSYPLILALGGQLKTTQCILKGNFAFVSPHIGDMETPQARDFFQESMTLMKRITESDPKVVACDYHPAYYSTKAAQDLSADKIIMVQHHHAHIVSCMVENQIEGKVIGLAMDGTGYGMDGNVWGGEFMIVDETGFERFGHLQYIVLPGGEKAIREPWRIAVSLLKLTYGAFWRDIAKRLTFMTDERQMELFDRIIDGKINSPLSSGLGRLFDGIAALLGAHRQVSYEGQAAMQLENLAIGSSGDPYPFELICGKEKPYILNITAMIESIVSEMEAGQRHTKIASSFHQTLIDAFASVAGKMREETGLVRVVLSGGCFQNKILLEGAVDKLKNSGFDVYCHQQVPSNDGGISLGQAVIAASMIQKGL
ncbi:MAG TPA: carbamoyltransferase HypF [Smithella sp.]|nr:carbamoyltransferase HypF [Smithella sp.]